MWIEAEWTTERWLDENLGSRRTAAKVLDEAMPQ